MTVDRSTSHMRELTTLTGDDSKQMKSMQEDFIRATRVLKKAYGQMNYIKQEFKRAVKEKEEAEKISEEKAAEVSNLQKSCRHLEQELFDATEENIRNIDKSIQIHSLEKKQAKLEKENAALLIEIWDMRLEQKRLKNFISALQDDKFDDSSSIDNNLQISSVGCEGCKELKDKLRCTRSANKTMAQAMVKYKEEAEKTFAKMMDMQSELEDTPKCEFLNQRLLVKYKTQQIQDLQTNVNELSTELYNIQQRANSEKISMTTEIDKLAQNLKFSVSVKESAETRIKVLEKVNNKLSEVLEGGLNEDNVTKGLKNHHETIKSDNIWLSARVKVLQEKLSEVTNMVVHERIHARALSDEISSQSEKIAYLETEKRESSNENGRLEIELEAISREHKNEMVQKDAKISEIECRLDELSRMIPEEGSDAAKWYMNQKNEENRVLRNQLQVTQNHLSNMQAAEDERRWFAGLVRMTDCQYEAMQEKQRVRLREALSTVETLQSELNKRQLNGDFNFYKKEMEVAQASAQDLESRLLDQVEKSLQDLEKSKRMKEEAATTEAILKDLATQLWFHSQQLESTLLVNGKETTEDSRDHAELMTKCEEILGARDDQVANSGNCRKLYEVSIDGKTPNDAGNGAGDIGEQVDSKSTDVGETKTGTAHLTNKAEAEAMDFLDSLEE